MINVGNYDFELDLDTRNTMSLIDGWITQGSVVMEFGPANGRLTKYLNRKKSCSMTIVEIDEDAGKEAAEFADEVYIGKDNGDIEKYYWVQTAKKYDYIILADVLEHLSDPKRVLQHCYSLLKEEGKILVSIPNLAHNSILISLYNDEFEYDKTGLLDRTHIHFFTNTSFRKMISNTGLYIYDTEPIYSRVGNNEIPNTYADIPIEVSTAIRKRNPGSIYQYVYMLGKDIKQERNSVKYEDIDKYEDEETTCYWTEPSSEEIIADHSISQIYAGAERVTVKLDMSNVVIGDIIRWDPLEHNCTIFVEKCLMEYEDGTQHELKYVKSNSSLKLGNYFYFKTDDPMIFYKVTEKNVKYLIFSFYLLKHGFTINEDDEIVIKEIGENSYTEERKEQDRIKGETIKQLYADVAHRDKDIAELKAYIEDANLKIEIQAQKLEQQTHEIEQQTHEIELQAHEIKLQAHEIELQAHEMELQAQNLEVQKQKIQEHIKEIEAHRHPIRHMFRKIRGTKSE